MNKTIKQFICIFIIGIIYLFIDWYQWDIIVVLSAKYPSLIAGLFFYFMFFLKSIIFIMLLIMVVSSIKLIWKNSKLKAICFLFAITFILLFQIAAPLSGSYIDFNYHLYSKDRQDVILMLNGDNKSNLIQSNENTYILPRNLRKTSHVAKITTEKRENSLNVLFYIHRGIFKSSALIYTSNNSLENAMFGFKMKEIRQLDSCWYSVVF